MDKRGMSNNLKNLINIERSKKMALNGDDVLIKEIYEDIAKFCGIGWETVKSYKEGKSIPSLPIALKLSEYFNVTVNDIFTINDYDKLISNAKNRGRKKSNTLSLCKYGECKNKVIAKGLCQRHYSQARNGKIKLD